MIYRIISIFIFKFFKYSSVLFESCLLHFQDFLVSVFNKYKENNW